MNYGTSQTLIVVLATLIIIGFVLWVLTKQWSSTKTLFRKINCNISEINKEEEE
jgi:hypothetical protein